MLQDSKIGACFGCFYCGGPTVADDVAVFGTCTVYCTYGTWILLRMWLWTTLLYSSKEAGGVPLNKDDKNSQCDIVFGEEPISKVQSATHLGIHREVSGRPDINEKVQLGRSTTYSPIGAGVYGGSDLCLVMSAHLWRIYVVHRVLYG